MRVAEPPQRSTTKGQPPESDASGRHWVSTVVPDSANNVYPGQRCVDTKGLDINLDASGLGVTTVGSLSLRYPITRVCNGKKAYTRVIWEVRPNRRETPQWPFLQRALRPL